MCNERYWTAENDRIEWLERPSRPKYSDAIEFRVVRWHSHQWSLQQVADRLNTEWTALTDENDHWFVCGYTVYREVYYQPSPWDGKQTEPEAICELEELSAVWTSKTSSLLEDAFMTPREAMTARCQKFGCLHRDSCVDGTTHDDALKEEDDQIREEEELRDAILFEEDDEVEDDDEDLDE